MKKMISTVISVLTAAAFLVPAGAMSTYAEAYDIAEVGSVPVGEAVFLSDISDYALTPSLSQSVLSNYSDGMHLFRDCLTDDNNLAVYSAFSALAEPTTETLSVTLPEPVVIELNGLPGSIRYTSDDAATYSEAILSNCQPGIDALLFDMPEVFWLDEANLSITPAYSWSRSRSGVYTVSIYGISFKPAYTSAYSSLAEVRTYKEQLEAAIEQIAAGATGETRYEKIKYIHDYIVDFTYYDINADFSGSAVGAIVEPGVVCEGYSKAFKLVCDYLGIPCTVVFGNYDPETRVAHMWDYVQMEDGAWYGVDVTWDDSSSSYKYFMRGSNSFFDSHTEENTYNYSTLSYPVISKTDFDPTAPIVTTSTSTTTTETTTTTTSETTTTVTETETTTSTTVTETTVTSTTVTETETTTESTTSSATETTVTSTESTTTSTTTADPEPLDGDLNCDGEVNIADLVCCLNAVLANGPVVYDCDYNKDGAVDIFDVIMMRQLIAKVVYNVDQ
ncbi:MAG: hypothetical protein IJM44_02045 [Ruminococcus sp.]|nr:hypothetical protein [Ruminococcus sp.]